MADEDCEDRKKIFDTLINAGCCKRCALRYVGDTQTNYDDPEENINELYCKDLNNHNGHDEQAFKKSKLNPCVICLDLLQDATIESMILSPELDKVLEYDCDSFVNYISFPVSVLIREHSMEIFLKEKFPAFLEDHHIVPLNRAWSLSIQNKLAQKLKKKFDRNASLQVQFTTSYELEKEESSVIYHIEDKLKKSNGHNDILSRNTIGESLKTIDAAVFQKHVPIPPQTPAKPLVLDQVSYKHEHLFIAGRYCKYSRNLFQTPWILEDTVIKSSVQEIIFQALDNIFNCGSLVFSSSGREDFDVRTLGRGRPFFIKICDPKITKVSFEKFRSIEEAIRQTNLVKVRDLQFIDRKYVNNIKEGEQFKQKTYRALCVVKQPENLQIYIDKINNISNIMLEQKTPIRVYHRRSSDVRKREIYKIKARPVTGKNNLFELDVVTQAGTYVKEFVHGDLGRTKPSLSDIIGGDVDILALDVLDIHLDFPPSLESSKY
ncbi:hypothetical protein MTP99_019369 [Tenebrio molitor]|nr:hypothetical protein MTP99_019369 [Tenebrio molitor]